MIEALSRRKFFRRTTRAAASLTLLPVEDLLRWHDKHLAADFDAKIGVGPRWPITFELLTPAGGVIDRRVHEWPDGVADGPARRAFVFALHAHETVEVAAIRYEMIDNGFWQHVMGVRTSPFRFVMTLEAGDTIEVTTLVGAEVEWHHELLAGSP
jgi:hypothetical protein